jgi:Na+/H+ antiporter NhaB
MIFENYTILDEAKRTRKEKYRMIVQTVAMSLLIIALATHLAW